jgi:hypothetical protein
VKVDRVDTFKQQIDFRIVESKAQKKPVIPSTPRPASKAKAPVKAKEEAKEKAKEKDKPKKRGWFGLR